MIIPEIGSVSSPHTSATKTATNSSVGFDQMLADASKRTASGILTPPVKAAADTSATDSVVWVSVALGVDTATGLDGTKWTRMDIGKVLTNADKQILGWPSDDPVIGMLGFMAASDRHDGTLKGVMTRDYILGNMAKDIAGLVERQPAEYMDSARVNAMLERGGFV